MLPHLMLLLGLIMTVIGFFSPIMLLFGVPLLLCGGLLYRGIYNRGNVIYWKWREIDQKWRVVLDKRKTILDRMANAIEAFSGFEGRLLREMSADRSAALFLTQSFPNIETMSATRELYSQIQIIENQINDIRCETIAWNKELQQLGTDQWFNKCLPAYVQNLLRPELLQPEGNLNPAADPGLGDINRRVW